MKKLELNQMERLQGGSISFFCAVSGLLFFPAHAAGVALGASARGIASYCLNN